MNPWPLIGNLLGWGLLVLIVAAMVVFVVLVTLFIRGAIRGVTPKAQPRKTSIISKETR